MLNNLTNFFNLIRGRKIKTTLADSDLIAIGVRDPRYDGNYQPSAIKFEDLQTQLGENGVQSVTDNGTGVIAINQADPQNPVVNFNGVFTDNVTIIGNGTVGNPLVAVGGSDYIETIVNVTALQTNTLFSNPIQLLPIPPVGQYIYIDHVIVENITQGSNFSFNDIILVQGADINGTAIASAIPDFANENGVWCVRNFANRYGYIVANKGEQPILQQSDTLFFGCLNSNPTGTGSSFRIKITYKLNTFGA